MAVNAARSPAPAFRLREDELPPELILHIERILDLHTTPDSDPLDRLTNDFNPVGVLNEYFPDGELSFPPASAHAAHVTLLVIQRLPLDSLRPCKRVYLSRNASCRRR